MTSVLSFFATSFGGVMALPFPGLGVPFGVVGLGLIALNVVLWAVKNLIGGD